MCTGERLSVRTVAGGEMGTENQSKVWDLLAKERDRGASLSVPALIKLAKAHNIALSLGDLWTLGARLEGGAVGEGMCPTAVSDLVVGLLHGVTAHAVLDPWVGFGTLLQPVVAALKPNRFVGVYPNAEALATARLVLPEGDAGTYAVGGIAGEVLSAEDKFDVVVSVPPFNLRKPPFTIDGIELRDFGGNELLLRSATRLRPGGIGLFVVPPSFLIVHHGNSVAANLARFDLYLDAAFLLPAGTFRPHTSIETYLVVVRRGPAPSQMFVAEGSPERQRVVLANYRKRKTEREPELGALVDTADFIGLRQMVLARTLEQQTKRLKVPAVRLGDIASIERCPRHKDKIVDEDNTLYLMLAGSFRVELNRDALPGSPVEWAVLKVNPAVADARVVAGYLSGSLGRLVLESHARGAKLPMFELCDLPVYLPNLVQQRSIVETDQRLRSLSEELDGLRSQLWRRLDKADEIALNLGRVNREDTFPMWLDTLPFPLASILWTYHTVKDEPLKRYNQLDFFFEGLAQFLAVLVLSAVRQDAGFPKAWDSVKKTLDGAHMSLSRATLGTWVAVFEGLAKFVRGNLDAPGAVEVWQRLFACDDPDLLAGLVGKKLVSVLKRANQLRNGWRGHGGIVGDDEAHRREGLYFDLLLEFRGVVEGRWEGYPLVLPQSSRHSQGRHHYSVAHVIGTRTPFDSSTLLVGQPMEDGQLHMAAPRLGATLPLLPLVRLGPAPKDTQNSCYFYNRVEGTAMKFVSYHFIDKPEIIEPSAGVHAILAELESS